MKKIRLKDLPGAEFIEKGLEDYASDKETMESYLVAIASPQLIKAQLIKEKPKVSEPELALYNLLLKSEKNAYSTYCSLLRRLVSFEKSLPFLNSSF